MVKQVRQGIDKLEALTTPIWGEDAEGNGWNMVRKVFLD